MLNAVDKRSDIFLISDSAAHFLVDAMCVLVVLGMKGDRGSDGMLIYNTLAFSTQCLVGLWVDGLDAVRTFRVKLASVLIVALTAFSGPALGIAYIPACVIAGIGNSFFHVSAGAAVMRSDGEKACRLGVFVAPGAFGITLGKLAVSNNSPVWPFYAAAAAVLAVFALERAGLAVDMLKPEYAAHPNAGTGDSTAAPAVLLTAAVAVRAIGGSAVSFTWSTEAWHGVLLTAFVWLGKTSGGFICDRIGAEKTAWISVPIAAVCVAFFSETMSLSLIGQLALNLTMPVTLWLLYRLMPDSPALAFGLAASALWPGSIIGMLFTLTGVWQWVCIAVSFGFGLFAVVCSCRILRVLYSSDDI